MSENRLKMIDREIAALIEARKPLTDILSEIDARIFELRQARFEADPTQKPPGDDDYTAPRAARKAPADAHPRERRALGSLTALPLYEGRVMGEKMAACYRIIQESHEISSRDVLKAVRLTLPDTSKDSLNLSLSRLCRAKLIRRVEFGIYAPLKEDSR